jgi:hypothetical protein
MGERAFVFAVAGAGATDADSLFAVAVMTLRNVGSMLRFAGADLPRLADSVRQ